MESTKAIQERLSSVRNIGKITRAMEVVAATKMRRSQEIALASRPYAFTALDMLGTLSRLKDIPLPKLLAKREIRRTAYMVVTSDKGLAGSFNGSVLKTFAKFISENNVDLKDETISVIAVGQKAATYFKRTAGSVTHAFTRFGDYTTPDEVESLSTTLIEGYLNGTWDEVFAFSTQFRTALKQEVIVERLFPVEFEAIRKAAEDTVPETGKYSDFRNRGIFTVGDRNQVSDYLLEPSPEDVLSSLAAHLVEMRIYHMMLEANASEHAARRVAMKNASDNASDLSETLTVSYNKSRQAAVTREILEIAAGAEALTNA